MCWECFGKFSGEVRCVDKAIGPEESEESHQSQLTQRLTSVVGLSISSPKKAIIGAIQQYDVINFRPTGFS